MRLLIGLILIFFLFGCASTGVKQAEYGEVITTKHPPVSLIWGDGHNPGGVQIIGMAVIPTGDSRIPKVRRYFRNSELFEDVYVDEIRSSTVLQLDYSKENLDPDSLATVTLTAMTYFLIPNKDKFKYNLVISHYEGSELVKNYEYSQEGEKTTSIVNDPFLDDFKMLQIFCNKFFDDFLADNSSKFQPVAGGDRPR